MVSRHRRVPGFVAAGVGLIGLVAGSVLGLASSGLRASPHGPSGGPIAGFRHVVYLSHLNNPGQTPGFPGDPRFFMTTAFTVPTAGYYLQYVREGEHTGTHWGAPCHFHVDEVCAGKLPPASLVGGDREPAGLGPDRHPEPSVAGLVLAIDSPLAAGPLDLLARDGDDPGGVELAQGRQSDPRTTTAEPGGRACTSPASRSRRSGG